MPGDNIKKIFENTIVKVIVALAIVGAVSGATLVFVYNYAMPKILVNIARETEKGIKNIFPEAAEINDSEIKGLYDIADDTGKIVGYAFLAEGNGYQGTIKLISGIDANATQLKGMEVLESQETPGLGAEITTKKFKSQFINLSITHPIEYLKNRKPEKDYQIEAITGATISSRAVVNILNKRVEEIRKELKK